MLRSPCPRIRGNFNTALLAALSTAQTALTAANSAYEESRDAALESWNGALTGLAGFTEAITEGDEPKILSTGFEVRAARTPPQPVPQILNVRVSFTGIPGHPEVRWKREAKSDAYVVQRSPEPITEPSWINQGTVTEVRFEGNGATPGVKYWYRVAGVNRLGQGPWSEPALRPVM